jgi:hypothetical protein
MKHRNQTDTSRWLSDASYNKEWASRSAKLVEMFKRTEAEDGMQYQLSEYGCGPYSPFTTVLREDGNFTVRKFDIKAWDPETRVCDLNDLEHQFEKSDIATFSGVLEYLNDVPYVLEKALDSHNYILASYAFVSLELKQNDRSYLGEIANRCLRHGWRNHYTNVDFIEIISSIGVVSDVGLWGDQSLFVVRKF